MKLTETIGKYNEHYYHITLGNGIEYQISEHDNQMWISSEGPMIVSPHSNNAVSISITEKYGPIK